ncbi:hypothetical protein [Nocardia sp. CA-290969]|uniref:hypothetical protein n=1 Tax=Nocardia sp. CA-290969 TaxID=3239986 RepID=UPI003D94B60C
MHDAIRWGVLGGMATPEQGNVLIPGSRIGFDSGCFGKGYPGDEKWLAWLDSMADKTEPGQRLWATAPDVVGDAAGTLKRSLPFLPKIRDRGFPAAFVAQNFAGNLPWDEFDVLFLGGIIECPSCLYLWPLEVKRTRRIERCPLCFHPMFEWKLSPAARDLTAEAKERGKWVHMGRVSSQMRIVYAVNAGVDSADGTYLTKGPDINLTKLLGWLDAIDRLDDEPGFFEILPEVSVMNPTLPRRVPTSGKGQMIVKGSLRHLCPFKDEDDDGVILLCWEFDGETFELHSLAAYLNSFRHEKVTHEELSHRIASDLAPWGVDVRTEFTTAALEVTVLPEVSQERVAA